MAVERIHDEGQTLKYPTGRVLGIVDTRADFDRLVAALQRSGFDKIEAICGDEGVNLLERVGGFFFSDMEPRVLERHVNELKADTSSLRFARPTNGSTKQSGLRRRTARAGSCTSA